MMTKTEQEASHFIIFNDTFIFAIYTTSQTLKDFTQVNSTLLSRTILPASTCSTCEF